MPKFKKISTLIGPLATPPLVQPDTITDSFATGGKLIASMLNNIKSEINDNDARLAAVEGTLRGVDVAIDFLADSAAFRLLLIAGPICAQAQRIGRIKRIYQYHQQQRLAENA